MNLRRTALLVACIATAALPCAAYVLGAAPPPDLHVAAAGAAVSIDQAVRMVEQRYHARVVKAQAEKDHDRTVYLLRLLDDSGKVWTVRVDAASGSVL